MIGGVSFQPGSLEQEQQRRQSATGSADGVQEAIKVLSLRLPKVVGAQAVAPSALLNSLGSGGNPHIDSIVESVLAKMFPGAGAAESQAPSPYSAPSQPSAPSQGPEVPTFTGNVQPSQPQRQEPQTPDNFWQQFPKKPNIIVGPNPTPYIPGVGGPGDFTIGLPGQPNTGGGQPPAMIGGPAPDLRQYLNWLPQGSDYVDAGPPLI